MAKPEARLWDWLRGVLPLGQYSRIESETSPGFPDVHYQLALLTTGTFELKAAQNPRSKIPFPNEDKGIRRSQRIWIRENSRLGGTVWILAEVGPRVFVIGGEDVEKINGATQVQLERLATMILSKKDPEGAAQQLRDLLLEEFDI